MNLMQRNGFDTESCQSKIQICYITVNLHKILRYSKVLPPLAANSMNTSEKGERELLAHFVFLLDAHSCGRSLLFDKTVVN